MEPTILLQSGNYFNLLEPRAEDIDIHDIAAALSKLCRFTGHVKTFYSVAQHSYLVAKIVPPEHALQALLHDASEAYIGDVSSPLKHQLPEYRAIEARIEAAIFKRFGLPPVPHPCIKRADLVLLATERRDMMPAHADEWGILDGIEPITYPIKPHGPAMAELIFMQTYVDLVNPTARANTFPQP
jgi:hypothetical protein